MVMCLIHFVISHRPYNIRLMLPFFQLKRMLIVFSFREYLFIYSFG